MWCNIVFKLIKLLIILYGLNNPWYKNTNLVLKIQVLNQVSKIIKKNKLG